MKKKNVLTDKKNLGKIVVESLAMAERAGIMALEQQERLISGQGQIIQEQQALIRRQSQEIIMLHARIREMAAIFMDESE